jgi:hypothetical protein
LTLQNEVVYIYLNYSFNACRFEIGTIRAFWLRLAGVNVASANVLAAVPPAVPLLAAAAKTYSLFRDAAKPGSHEVTIPVNSDVAPTKRPSYFGTFDPRPLGIEFSLPPVGAVAADNNDSTVGPHPGWFAVSGSFLRGLQFPLLDSDNRIRSIDYPAFTYFEEFEPVAMAGYSIYIYHLDTEQVDRVRPRLGLPPLSERTGRSSHNGRDLGAQRALIVGAASAATTCSRPDE